MLAAPRFPGWLVALVVFVAGCAPPDGQGPTTSAWSILSETPDWIGTGDQAAAMYGTELGTAGDVNGDGYADVVVTAIWYDGPYPVYDEGQAFVYHGSATGPSAVEDWSTGGGVAYARLGAASTAGDIDGDGYDDLIVGAYSHPMDGYFGGRAALHLGSATGLSASEAWFAGPGQSHASFGNSVAGAGDVNGDGYSDVLVGAPGWDGPLGGEGKVFGYFGSSTGLSSAPDWTWIGPEADALAGEVAGAGDVNGDGYSDVLVGAWGLDGAVADEGGAVLFFGSTSGPGATPDWTVTSGQASSNFGLNLAGAGDVNGDGFADVLVGAESWDAAWSDQGRAFLYYGSASGPSSVPDWTGEVDQQGVHFGYWMTGAGDLDGDGFADLAVGGYGYMASAINGGAAFVYLGSPTGPGSEPDFTSEPDQSGEMRGPVGAAGDIDGDGYGDLLVGAYQYDDGENSEGAAFLYLGGQSLLADEAEWFAYGGMGAAYMGASVAIAGDVDGDGYDDVYTGVEGYSDPENREGAVFVYPGSPDGPVDVPWTAQSDTPVAWLGRGGDAAGDVNGDGYADVIGGAFYYEDAFATEGAAFVYQGSPTGMDSTPAWTATGGQLDARFGYSAAGAGDVNGDGYDDVVVGAYMYDDGETDEGAAFVYLGSPTGVHASADWISTQDQAGGYYATHVAAAGDPNGDGYGDVLVATRHWDGALLSEGAAWVFFGSAAGLEDTASWSVEGGVYGAGLGYSGGDAGDVNGDGYDDLVIGWLNGPQAGGGGAFSVYHGSPTGPPTTPDIQVEGDNGPDHLGNSVMSAGDVNGDGYGDLVAGAYGQTWGGGAYVYLGSPAGLDPLAAWSASLDLPYGARFGWRVGGGGDINGDGYGDVVISAVYHAGGSGNEGAIFVYFGNGDGEVLHPAPSALTALRPGDVVPIPPGHRSGVSGAFDVVGLARSPFGRTGAKLEIEVKPEWVPFDGTGLVTTAAWTDTGTGGVEITEQLTGLAVGAHHWRARWLYDPADALPLKRTGWIHGGRSGEPLGRHVLLDVFDEDGDGFEAPADCDDADPSIFPGAAESCDATDSDCDGSLVDEFDDTDGDADPDCTDPDDDGDGDPDASDCAPLDATIFTGAAEACDGIDSDCDGDLVDEFDDLDGDGDPDCVDPDDDGDGDPDTSDCDDADASVYTGAPEACDGADSDCDGSIVDAFIDTDGDGQPDCVDPDDDDDGILDVDEGAGDIDGDGIPDSLDLDDTDGPDADPDGDGLSNGDEAIIGTDPLDPDTDGDGDGDASDCDPLDPTAAAGLPEICDGADVDNDCDLATGDHLDADGDGHTLCDGDCDDDDPSIHPGATEVCEDGVDQDCDGADEACGDDDDAGDDDDVGDDDDIGDDDDAGDDDSADDDDSAGDDDDVGDDDVGDDDDDRRPGCGGCSAGDPEGGALAWTLLLILAARRGRSRRNR